MKRATVTNQNSSFSGQSGVVLDPCGTGANGPYVCLWPDHYRLSGRPMSLWFMADEVEMIEEPEIPYPLPDGDEDYDGYFWILKALDEWDARSPLGDL